MSQHFYKTTDSKGRKVEVMLGFDRPLDGYIYCLFDAAGDIIYSNLSEKVSHPKTLQPYLDRMQAHGVKVPLEIIRAVEEDARVQRQKARNGPIENRVKHWKY